MAAVGTVGALFVIYRQLQETRREGRTAIEIAEEDRHAAVTPLLSVTVGDWTHAVGSDSASGVLSLQLNGSGVAYAIHLAFETFEGAARPLNLGLAETELVALHAPTTYDVKVTWRNPEVPVQVNIIVSFVNALNRRINWTWPCVVDVDRFEVIGPPSQKLIYIWP
jgi:hypothetical protein